MHGFAAHDTLSPVGTSGASAPTYIDEPSSTVAAPDAGPGRFDPADPVHAKVWAHYVDDIEPPAQGGTPGGRDAGVDCSKQDGLEGHLQAISSGFLWLYNHAQQRLEALRRDLHAREEPGWSASLAEALLEVALLGGAAAGGELIAGLLVESGEHGAVKKELVKAMFEEGIAKGVEAGRERLAGANKDRAIDAFIDSQIEGVAAMHQENQTRFLLSGRNQVQTVKDAENLEGAFAHAHLERAADEQYAATRDAWLSYLAQSTYGDWEHDQADGSRITATNMETQAQRDRENDRLPGWVPSEAPSLERAVFGKSPGVLEVAVTLPAINDGTVQGSIEATLAVLDGVNEEIRKQYEGNPLSQIHIPRQIVASGAASFTLNLDERGTPCHILPRKQGLWLETFGKLDNPNLDDFAAYQTGIVKLLGALVLDKVSGELW